MAQSSITDEDGELTYEARKEIKRIFRLIDTTGNGKIGVNDLMRSMQLSGGNPTKEEAQRMIDENDMDGSGSVEYQEFENIMKIHILALEYQNDILRDAFKRFDKNGDGSLDCEELRKVLCSIGESLTDEEAEEMFKMVDVDNNGKVDLDEFLNAFKASWQSPRPRPTSWLLTPLSVTRIVFRLAENAKTTMYIDFMTWLRNDWLRITAR